MNREEMAERIRILETVFRILRPEFKPPEIEATRSALSDYTTDELAQVKDRVLKKAHRGANVAQAFATEIDEIRSTTTYKQPTATAMIDGPARDRTQERVDARRRLKQGGLKSPTNRDIDEEIARTALERANQCVIGPESAESMAKDAPRGIGPSDPSMRDSTRHDNLHGKEAPNIDGGTNKDRRETESRDPHSESNEIAEPDEADELL
ncbi:MAG TPA: hypothetical protein PKA37_10010 [Planctomycetota bacterium]|jgi:hypothetical protein|nr:hypothetical protein [Planctomycetota bacterium]